MAAPFPSPTSKWHSEAYDSISPSRPELSAKGKTVLVTGGGTGIGAETALYFAQAGASRIALLGRREQPLLDTKATIEQKYPGVDVFVASTDVSKKSEVDAAFANFLGDAKLNVLISNAAIQGPIEGVLGSDVEAFMNGIHVNIVGAVHLAQAFLRHAAPDAVVVDVNTAAAHMNIADKFASYSVAKLAVFRLWDHMSFNHPNLSVFHIQPGIVDTAMNRAAGGIAATGIEDNVSLPAGFNVWLASPEARFLNGKFLWTNWDVDELKAQAKELEAGSKLSIGLVGWPFNNSDWKIETSW